MRNRMKRWLALLMAALVLVGTAAQSGGVAFAGYGARAEALSVFSRLDGEEGMADGPVLDDRHGDGFLSLLNRLFRRGLPGDAASSGSDAVRRRAARSVAARGSASDASLSDALYEELLRFAEPERRTDGLFAWYEEDGSAVVTGFAEGKSAADLPEPGALELPERMGGKTVKRVDPFAFYQAELESVTLGASVEEAGDSSFAGNRLTELSGAEGLRRIGASAFRDNLLQSVSLEAAEEVAEEAFADNRLESVAFGEMLRSVGDRAFSYNNLNEVFMPDGVRAYGSAVFASNNRYVLIHTGADVIRTEVIAGEYGQAVNPVTVVIRAVDQATGEPILADTVFGLDREDLNGLVFLNQENTYRAAAINGFEPVQPALSYTPDQEGYVLTVPYRNVHILPRIDLVKDAYIPLNGDGQTAALLSFVRATDLDGADISASVTVEPERVDTGVSGQIIPLIYRVTDKYGNIGTREVKLSVGVNWKEFPLGKGWTLGDFTYDANKVTGFSESGLTKVQTQKELILPHLNPEDGATVIDTVACIKDDALSFRKRELTFVADYLSLTGEGKGNIKLLEGSGKGIYIDPSYPDGAFSNNHISQASLNALERAEEQAFQGNRFTELHFPELEEAGSYAFQGNPLVNIEEDDLPKLEKIGYGGLMGNVSRVTLDRVHLPSLREAGRSSFVFCKCTDVNFPNLEIVGDGAFLGDGLTEVTEERFPKLRVIGGAAFRDNYNLTRISLPMVREIGEDAFRGSQKVVIEDRFDNLERLEDGRTPGRGALSGLKLTTVHMPKLQRIGAYAFSGNPGVPEYGGKVVVWTEERGLPSRENYIVNPEEVTDLEWRDTDFVWDAADPSMVLGFTGTGQVKLAKKNYALVLPARARIVGSGAFDSCGIVSVSAPGVEEVRDSGFYANKLTDISGSFPRLRRISESWAFGANRLTELDLPLVETVGERAFSGNGKLRAVRLESAKQIGNGAFLGAPLEELSAPLAETIGEMAFSYHKLTALELPKAREIGFSAFAKVKSRSAGSADQRYPEQFITGYEKKQLLSLKLPEAETVDEFAFSGNHIKNLEAPRLRKIGRRAFDENEIKEDLELPLAETVGVRAFGSNRMDRAYFGQALTELAEDAFRYVRNNNGTQKEVLVFLMDGAEPGGNPNGLKDGYIGTTRQHIVNPTHVRLSFVDADGQRIAEPVSEYIYEAKTYEAPKKFGYLVDKQTLTVPDDRQKHEEVFSYTKTNYSNTGGVELRQGNEINLNSGQPMQSYHIGEIMTSWVYLDVTDHANTYRKGEIKLYYDPKYVDEKSIKVRGKGSSIRGFKVSNGEVSIQLATNGSVTGGYSLSLPVEWKFKKYVTPDHHAMELNALFTEDGKPVSAAAPISLEGYCLSPWIRKSSPLNLPDYEYGRLTPESDGPRLMGALGEYETPEGTRAYKVREPMAVRYDFSVSHLERYVSSAVITDTLPKYVAVREDGTEEIRDAVFEARYNPDWSLGADAEGNQILTQSKSFPQTLWPGKYFSPLYLSYPDLKSGHNVVNKVEITLSPHDRGEREGNFSGRDELSIYTGFYAPRYYKGDPRFDKLNTGAPRTDGIVSYFYDTPSERQRVIPYLLRVSSMAERTDLRDVMITDYDLDRRLYYCGVSFPRNSHTAGNLPVDVIAYRREGDGLSPDTDRILYQEHVVMEQGNEVIFPEELAREIDYLCIVLPADHEVFSALEFYVNTKLRNPEQKQYDPAALKEGNVYKNYAVMSGNLFHKGSSAAASQRGDLKEPDGPIISKYRSAWDALPGNYFWGEHAEVYVRDYAQSMGIDKRQSYPDGRAVYPGESGDYVLSLDPGEAGGAAIAAPGAEDLKNFEMIDLMPDGIALNQVIVSDGFRRSGGQYELIENYGGTGQTALRFHAALLKAGVYYIATLKTSASPSLKEGFAVNRLYADFENPAVKKVGTVKKLPGDASGKDWLYDETAFRFMKAKEMYAVKYIRRAGELAWSSTGVTTESEGRLEYKLQLVNNLDTARENIQAVDFFPYPGDTNIQEENIGNHVRRRRNSEFENRFDTTRAVKLPAGYKVYYWNSDTPVKYGNKSADLYIEGLNWSETPAANTRGIKVVSEPGVKLGAEETLEIIVPMVAPKNDLDNDFALTGKRAWNSFVRKDAQTIRFVEPNVVYNELSAPLGSISFTKFAQEGLAAADGERYPLAGAEFEAKDSRGTIYRAVSGADGKVLFTGLPIKESYTITESVVPEGYRQAQDGGRHEAVVRYEDFKRAYNPNAAESSFPVVLSDELSKEQFINIKPISGDLTLAKINEAGEPLPYVRFRVEGVGAYNRDFNKVLLTGENGTLRAANLPEGEYRVTELRNASETGYEPAAPFSFTIDKDHRHISFTGAASVVNRSVQLVINKVAVAADFDLSKSLAELTGFGLKRLDGYRFEIREAGNAAAPAILTEESKNGAVIVRGLRIGVLYEISEIKKDSTIYRHNERSYRFRLNSRAELTDENGKLFRQNILNFPNPKKKVFGEVEIEKIDGEGRPLTGAVFGLYQNDTLISEAASELRGDGRSTAVFRELPPGVYTIRETAAPRGYLLSRKSYNFTVPHEIGGKRADIEDGGESITKKFSFRCENRPIRLEVIKGDTLIENISAGDARAYLEKNPGLRYRRRTEKRGDIYLPLQGAAFALYRKNADGSRTKELTLVSDPEGRLDFSGYTFDANYNYALVETRAPEGYRLDSFANPEISLNIRDESLQGGFEGAAGGVLKRYKENQPVRGRILISKRDADERSALAGAVFALYKAGETGGAALQTAESNASGMVEFRNLELGSYIVRELSAPAGYQPSVKEYRFDLTAADATGSVVVNNPHYVEFEIEKVWHGKKADEALVRVLQNGKPAKDRDGRPVEELRLNRANGWKAEVKNLPAFDENGKRYVYALEEAPIEGYASLITGSADYGVGRFTVHNSEEGRTVIGVTKRWDGKMADHVTVHLLADGEDSGKSAVLSRKNRWQHVFTGLPEKDKEGRKILYTVREDPLPGYTTEYEGDAKKGFTVINREIPEKPPAPPATPSNPSGGGGGGNPPRVSRGARREVKVTKLWEGRPLDAVEIYLYRDGSRVGTASLSEQNGWSHVFQNLPARDAKDGHRFLYTVQEARCEGYDTEIAGDEDSGFVVTNRELPPGAPGREKPGRPSGRLPRTGERAAALILFALSALLLGALFLARRRGKEN